MWLVLSALGVVAGVVCLTAGVYLGDMMSVVVGAVCLPVNAYGVYLELTK